MICGICKAPMKGIRQWVNHVREFQDVPLFGCTWDRDVWERHGRAKERGSSGRRILSERYPHLWKPRRMGEEAKEKLQALADKRRVDPKVARKLKRAKQKRRIP